MPVGDVIEQGPDLLELGFSHSQIAQAAKHLGAVSKVSPVGHLDEQCRILWGELLPLSLAVALSKCLHPEFREENAGQYRQECGSRTVQHHQTLLKPHQVSMDVS